jgi:hypothetical protein
VLQDQSVNRSNRILNHSYDLLNSSESNQIVQNSSLPYDYLNGAARNGLEDHLVSIAVLGQKHLREFTPSNSSQNSVLIRAHGLKRFDQFLLDLLDVLFLLLVYYVRVITALNLAHYKKKFL